MFYINRSRPLINIFIYFFFICKKYYINNWNGFYISYLLTSRFWITSGAIENWNHFFIQACAYVVVKLYSRLIWEKIVLYPLWRICDRISPFEWGFSVYLAKLFFGIFYDFFLSICSTLDVPTRYIFKKASLIFFLSRL